MDVYIGATWQIQLIDFFRDGYAAFGRITLIICYILGRIARTNSKYAANVLSMLRGLCVCVSADYYHELCKNGRTDRDAVWGVDSGGPKKPCYSWGSGYLRDRGNFGIFQPLVK